MAASKHAMQQFGLPSSAVPVRPLSPVIFYKCDLFPGCISVRKWFNSFEQARQTIRRKHNQRGDKEFRMVLQGTLPSLGVFNKEMRRKGLYRAVTARRGELIRIEIRPAARPKSISYTYIFKDRSLIGGDRIVTERRRESIVNINRNSPYGSNQIH